MPNFAAQPSWTRLEPLPHDPSLEQGLAAEVHDPMWLLTRQLQFRELRGTDAGSPVCVGLVGQAARLTRYLPRLPDGGPGEPIDPALPLERHVEAEPLDADPLRFAARAGLRFRTLLGGAGLDQLAAGYRAAFPLTMTPASAAARRFLAIVGRGAPDGVALAAAITAAGDRLPAVPAVPVADRAAGDRVAAEYLRWYRALAGPAAASAWRPERFEYQLSVAGATGAGEAVYAASEYEEGRLDWSSFDLVEGATLGAAAEVVELRSIGLPTPVTFRGQPASRFWEFEDGAFDIGDVSAAADELSKLLVVEFALVYGNDHFVVPLDVDVGSYCGIEDLQVIDTFGVVTTVPHISRADVGRPGAFRLFEGGTAGRRTSLFLLAPTLGQALDGPPVEEVRMARDEGANLGWAIETVVSPDDGFPTDPSGAASAGAPAAGSGGGWQYRLRTAVATSWFPLVPIADGPGAVHLELGSAPPTGGGSAPQPLGRILDELTDLAVPEEEITRAPSRVVRTWQYARWTDGSQHLWLGRERRPVSPVNDSGLRFDTVDPPGITRDE